MTEIAAYLVNVGHVLRKQVRRLRKRKVSPAFVLVAVSIAVAVPIAGDRLDGAWATTTRDVDGLELKKYCDGLGFDGLEYTGTENYCRTAVDLLEACKFTYKDAERKTQDAGDPSTGTCWDADGKNLGGVRNMLGHCKDKHDQQWSDRVEPSPDNGWCRIRIDESAVCAGQLNDSLATAEWTKRKTWRCFTTRPQEEG